MNNAARAPTVIKRQAEPDILRENVCREGKRCEPGSQRAPRLPVKQAYYFNKSALPAYFFGAAGADVAPPVPELLKYLK